MWEIKTKTKIKIMPTKLEIFKTIDESPIKSYTPSLVKNIIQSVKVASTSKPTKLKIGDVFTYSTGTKTRPVVVISIKGELVFGITLSTTEDKMNLMPGKSRFFGEGWFGKSLITATKEKVMENFIGIYDNEKLVRLAKLELKKLIATI